MRQIVRTLTLAFLLGLLTLPVGPAAEAMASRDNTWGQLGSLPGDSQGPLFALAVDPQKAEHLLAGTKGGSIYSSSNAGSSWHQVASGLGGGVLTIAAVADQPGVWLAGTEGAGIWRSQNQGESWKHLSTFSSATVRAIASSPPSLVAGSDQGLLESSDGTEWRSIGPSNLELSAAAVSQNGALLIGGDSPQTGGGFPLFASSNDGQSWNPQSGAAVGSSMVEDLVAWPDRPQVIMGTNTGAFLSTDGGSSWSSLSGGGTLPATDITSIARNSTQAQNFYLGSDGGGSNSGGLWATRDSGEHFSSLNPPFASVTALAVSGGDVPQLYVATFNPQDQSLALWGYRDAGGAAVTPPTLPQGHGASSLDHGNAKGRNSGLLGVLRSPELPFWLIGILSLVILFLAWGRTRRRQANP